MMTCANPSININIYHYSPSLLFQFILTEFIQVHQTIQRLNSLCHTLPQVSCCDTLDRQIHEQIESLFSLLVGVDYGRHRLVRWSRHEGSLTKLKSYHSLFANNHEQIPIQLYTQLQHYIDKLFHACQKGIDSLQEEPVSLKQIVILVDKATIAIQRLSKPLTRLMHHFNSNENVLFYLLRRHEELDQINGKGFTAKLLGRFFPRGLHEAERVISAKYASRGFENILPMIQAKIAENGKKL